MALAGPSLWREAALPRHGVRWNTSVTAQWRGVKTGLSQRSWWPNHGNVSTWTSSFRSSSHDAHSAGDEESSARRGMADEYGSDNVARRPPTPTPVFRRRPKRGKGRARLMDLPLPPRPSPTPMDQSAFSLQAARQENSLFKGIARQITDLSALGLPSSQALQMWRSSIERDHEQNKPGRKHGGSSGSKTAVSVAQKTRNPRKRRCGVCGAEGHNARTCALSVRKSSENLVRYYESKYGGDVGDVAGTTTRGEGEDAYDRASQNARAITPNKVGRPSFSKTILVRCSVCGGLGHNKRSHGEKTSHTQRRPGPQNACVCSSCGEQGHNSRGCPLRRGKVSGYGFQYGFAFGRSFGFKYGHANGGGAWVPTAMPYDLTSEDTKRHKVLETRAALLWLRSANRSSRTGTETETDKKALTVPDACVLVGVHKRFKQNVWNATKTMQKNGWEDDGEVDEFLEVNENQNGVEVEVA